MSINFLFKFELNVDSFGSGSRRGVDDSEVVYVIVLVWSSPANYYFYMKMFFFWNSHRYQKFIQLLNHLLPS